MKTYFQILLGALPIALLAYIFFSAQNIKEGNALLSLAKDISKEHFTIMSKSENFNKFGKDIIKNIEENLSRTYDDKALKFLINTDVDQSNDQDIILITQSRFQVDPRSKDEIHIAILANGKISSLSREQYNKLDLTKFKYSDELTTEK
ncbi:hypothetical protein PQO01_07590 [Lentisphaera marina]|uniref:hypothetical protein n=1 Tax=Lentisphaera marina TaxID=1111041 RepID=UPI002365A46C|nr:hypothetical protein [Lentisphaera marina]MDD7984807.1 hypothetical protein [Lentisphaera marina]